MTDATRFWDKIAPKYARRAVGDMASYEYKLNRTRAHMRPDMNVLEFACGTGTTALHHAPHVASYRAVDISPEMIRIARAKDGAERVGFEVADFDTLEIAPESLDMIQAHSILHLLPDPPASIAKVHTSLKPGGLFVSSTSCLGYAWWLKPIVRVGHALGKLPALSWFTEDDLRGMLVSHGFEIIEDWQPKGSMKALFLVARKSG
ncbi:class I SAM-dependent methyltransferase [Aliiroseovarius sp.]|uniref:class I SAM-dependent methyltransferase n=1 Tax=Aliiroseovarius sp. TaxID=1872442 RepID=UPI002609E938|nr:class I SAM-dependent methyltransferase [Aliiroseovarius sp.]